MSERDIIEKSVQIIQKKMVVQPEIGMILGSGLGDYADGLENRVTIPYSELPGFPVSTVPEALVCAHSGIPVLGISCITNLAAGILDQPLDHKEVVETADRVKNQFIQILDLAISKVID